MMRFEGHHIEVASSAFSSAESLVSKRFRLHWNEMKRHHYDVKTLAQLSEGERSQHAFAHLCRYQYEAHPEAGAGSHFYRVCLQDDRILDAVMRAGTCLSLASLLLYIATHELVHVVRFDRLEADFNANGAEKDREEERVHTITHEILSHSPCRDLRLIRDYFSSRYNLMTA